jgi:hypothetical protein
MSGNRIVTRVKKVTTLGTLLGAEQSFVAEAIDRRTGEKAVRSAATAEEAEFLAIDELTRRRSFREG